MTKKFIGNDCVIEYHIDTIEKAYTLGFLWGDGHLTSSKYKDGNSSDVHYVALEIAKTDLDKIIDLFSVWGEWNLSIRKRENRQEQGQIILIDKYFGWFLTQNDYVVKSNVEPTKILSLIPEELKPYWWRGYIDSDGCFYNNTTQYLNQFSLAGTFQQEWNEAENLFKSLDILKYSKQYRNTGKSKSSTIRINNRKDITKLGSYIYSDNLPVGLERKYNKYLEIKV